MDTIFYYLVGEKSWSRWTKNISCCD